ncbi:unnamed protein product [Aphanomyces euteiches]
MALFDISGFSTLADHLAKQETIKLGEPSRPTPTASSTKTIDVSWAASHRRINLASSGRQQDSISINDKRGSMSSKSEKRASAGGDLGLMRMGMAVEQLTKNLNQTLTPVIDIITRFNGDIIKFAGDAMIVMWKSEASSADAVDPGVLIFTAITCALQVLAMLESTHVPSGPVLQMHVGLGFSNVSGNHVGGVLNRWEFYIGGSATSQMSIAESEARAGELVISPECYVTLVSSPAVQPLRLASKRLPSGNYNISAIASDLEVKYLLPTVHLGRELIPLVKAYVPGCIALSLGNGKIVINGMRSITAIFIKFFGILDIAESHAQLREVHRCLCAVQDAAYRVHATIRQFLIDDKGAVAIVVVGLPPFYHENNALHGIRMALYLQEKGVRASIGITSGPAFCGSVGSAVRAEYAVVGDVINLSARLMAMATPGQILCDETTHAATVDRFQFDQGTHVMVKGKGDFIVVYRVFLDSTDAVVTDQPPPGEFFMPDHIYENVIKRVEEFSTRTEHSTTNACQSIIIRGASGVGKTALLRHLSHIHDNVCYSCGDSVEKNTKLFVWRKVISRILFGTHKNRSMISHTEDEDLLVDSAEGKLPSSNEASQPDSMDLSAQLDDGSPDIRAHFAAGLQFVQTLVQSGAITSDSLPLLNVFIPHCFPETSYSLQIAKHESRFLHEINVFVVAVLANARQPLLLAWDDSQWIDAASWGLLVHVLTALPTVACVIGVRPDAPPPHVEFKCLETLACGVQYELQNLSLRDTSLFLSHVYGIAIMNSYVLEFAHDRARGNPGNTIALMQRLLELETISIDVDRGVVHVLKDFHDVDLEVSLQIRAKVMSHFDNLNAASQLALRIASVSTEDLDFDALHYILRTVYSIEYSLDDPSSTTLFVQALQGMAVCAAHGVLEIDHSHELVRYRSDDMRLVVYNVMLPSQRETIHRIFALWFEQKVPLHRIPRFQHYYYLAFHLSRTCMYNQSLHYFAKGAEEALLRGVSDFALKCLTAAGAVLLIMDSPISPSPPFLRSLSSTKSIAPAPSDEETSTTIEVTMYQCKIEFLTGLVMIQKSDWSTAVETFNAAITILERVREMDKRSRPWDRHTRRLRRWWNHTLRRPTNAVLPAKAHPRQGLQYRPSRDQLVDEVEAYMVVAKRLKAKILKAERDRDRINNDIRVQGLRCISKVSDQSVNLEKEFVLVPAVRRQTDKRFSGSSRSSGPIVGLARFLHEKIDEGVETTPPKGRKLAENSSCDGMR